MHFRFSFHQTSFLKIHYTFWFVTLARNRMSQLDFLSFLRVLGMFSRRVWFLWINLFVIHKTFFLNCNENSRESWIIIGKFEHVTECWVMLCHKIVPTPNQNMQRKVCQTSDEFDVVFLNRLYLDISTFVSVWRRTCATEPTKTLNQTS